MRHTVELEVTVTVEIEVDLIPREDDDGCGDSSKTGNSMTGSRPCSGWNVEDWKLANPKAVLQAITDSLDTSEIQEVVDESDISDDE